MFGKDNKKKELVNNLGDIYARIEREHQISPGDFPNLRKMQVSSGILVNMQGKSIRVTAGNTTDTDCRHLWEKSAVMLQCVLKYVQAIFGHKQFLHIELM